jgi:hypothetical protein
VEPTHNNGAALQFILLAAVLIPAIFFLLTEHKTLQLIRPWNRRMLPGLVWLQLIPLFGQIWQFFVVIRIAASIRKELESPRGDSIIGVSDIFAAGAGRKPTLGIGIAYCILHALAVLMLFSSTNVPERDGLFSLAGMVCWIIYWVKLAGFKKKLQGLSLVI